jgi:translation initiation factor IF-3
MEVSGKVKVINAEQQVSATFKKRELVVTTDEQYPQHIMIEFTQDKCDLLNNYTQGEAVKVSINLRGREWVNPQGETKYFNTLQAWKIEKQQSADNTAASSTTVHEAEILPPQSNSQQIENDMPF